MRVYYVVKQCKAKCDEAAAQANLKKARKGMQQHAMNQAETHFGQPQDMEWAMDDTGGLYLLQARTLRIASPGGAGAEGMPTVAKGPNPTRNQTTVSIQAGVTHFF